MLPVVTPHPAELHLADRDRKRKFEADAHGLLLPFAEDGLGDLLCVECAVVQMGVAGIAHPAAGDHLAVCVKIAVDDPFFDGERHIGGGQSEEKGEEKGEDADEMEIRFHGRKTPVPVY